MLGGENRSRPFSPTAAAAAGAILISVFWVLNFLSFCWRRRSLLLGIASKWGRLWNWNVESYWNSVKFKLFFQKLGYIHGKTWKFVPRGIKMLIFFTNNLTHITMKKVYFFETMTIVKNWEVKKVSNQLNSNQILL